MSSLAELGKPDSAPSSRTRGQVAAAAPVGHTSVVNALDLRLGGLSTVIINKVDKRLTAAALRLPYLERTVLDGERAKSRGGNLTRPEIP